MHKNIEKIKKFESSPKVVRNIFKEYDIKKFLNYMKSYRQLFTIKTKCYKKDGLKIII